MDEDELGTIGKCFASTQWQWQGEAKRSGDNGARCKAPKKLTLASFDNVLLLYTDVGHSMPIAHVIRQQRNGEMSNLLRTELSKQRITAIMSYGNG